MVCEAWIVNKILAGPTSYFLEALKLALVGLAVALLDQISFLAAIFTCLVLYLASRFAICAFQYKRRIFSCSLTGSVLLEKKPSNLPLKNMLERYICVKIQKLYGNIRR